LVRRHLEVSPGKCAGLNGQYISVHASMQDGQKA
jgi:hypothetical protein